MLLVLQAQVAADAERLVLVDKQLASAEHEVDLLKAELKRSNRLVEDMEQQGRIAQEQLEEQIRWGGAAAAAVGLGFTTVAPFKK